MNSLITRLLGCLLFSLPIFFSACIKDSCSEEHAYVILTPVYQTKARVLEGIRGSTPKPVEHPGKLYQYGKYIFLNEIDRGVHIIDNSDPGSPKNVSFISIPGNLDIAVKGDRLYADMYSELVTLDISDALNVQVKSVMPGIFPGRQYVNGFAAVNTDNYIVEWNRSDTLIKRSCDQGRAFFSDNMMFETFSALANSASPGTIGMAGSMARFSIIRDRMYVVNETDLLVMNIENGDTPAQVNRLALGWGIETIYPFKDQLFIGSQEGMYVYSLDQPDNPTHQGRFSHVRSCDPVVADDNYAYVTLRSGTACQGFTNELDIISLTERETSGLLKLVKKYEMKNPHGLSKLGNILFICDGDAGLKVFDASKVSDIRLLNTYPMNAYDIIAGGNHAIVVAKDGLYQFSFTNTGNLQLLSKIGIQSN